MTLVFYNPALTQQFVALCKSKGYHGTITRGAEKEVVRVTGFSNKTAYVNLTALWATMSISR